MSLIKSASPYSEASTQKPMPARAIFPTRYWRNRHAFAAPALFCAFTAGVIAWPHSTREIAAIAGTRQMEVFIKILQHATAITSNDASDLRQLLAQREFDCRQAPCSAVLAARNQRARRELSILAEQRVLENPMMAGKQALRIPQ